MNSSFRGRCPPSEPRCSPQSHHFYPQKRPPLNHQFVGEQAHSNDSYQPPPSEQYRNPRDPRIQPAARFAPKNSIRYPPPQVLLDQRPPLLRSRRNSAVPLLNDPPPPIVQHPPSDDASTLEDLQYKQRVQRSHIFESAIMDRLKRSLEASFMPAIDPQHNQV